MTGVSYQKPARRLHAGVEIPAVLPVFMADGLVAVVHVDVQGIVGGPARPDGAHFEAQVVQRLVGHTQGQGIGQLHGTVGVTIPEFPLGSCQRAIKLGFTIDIGCDLGLVGQAHRPLIVHGHAPQSDRPRPSQSPELQRRDHMQDYV